MLLAEELDDDFALAGAVKLDEEKALPLAEGRPAADDRDVLTGPEEDVLAMGMSVRDLSIFRRVVDVVFVVVVVRQHSVEQCFEV